MARKTAKKETKAKDRRAKGGKARRKIVPVPSQIERALQDPERSRDEIETAVRQLRRLDAAVREIRREKDEELRPHAERGEKILRHAHEGGTARAKQIADEHEGLTLEKARPMLLKRLAELRAKGHSKRSACITLARDLPWSPDYLRTRL